MESNEPVKPHDIATEHVQVIDKIAVLLREYDTLRAEMIARMNSRFAFVGLVMGVLAFWWTSGRRPSEWVVALLIVILFAAWFYMGQLMNRLSRGIQRIEKEVNERAQDHLLDWESCGRSPLFARMHGLFSRQKPH